MKVLKISMVLGALLLTGCSSYGDKITVGDTDIFYRDGATQADAQKVADVLKKDSFIDSAKTAVTKSIRVLKPGGKYALEFVFNDKAIADEGSVSTMRAVVASDVAAEAFGGAPTDLHLCDDHFVTKKDLPVEFVKKVTFGDGSILKTSQDISDDESKKLLAALSDTFGKTNGAMIAAKKSGNLPVILLVVPDAKQRTDKVAQETFKPIAEAVSKKAFNGAKVEFDLCDAHLLPAAHVTT